VGNLIGLHLLSVVAPPSSSSSSSSFMHPLEEGGGYGTKAACPKDEGEKGQKKKNVIQLRLSPSVFHSLWAKKSRKKKGGEGQRAVPIAP
jgi:hypothetical protein